MSARTRHCLPVAVAAVAMTLASCAGVDPRADFDATRELIAERTGRSDVFDPLAPVLTTAQLDAVLEGGLSLDEAERLALTNARDFQAEFLSLGIAHADRVQAELLTNPSLGALLRVPTDGGSGSTFEAVLGFQLLELWQIPARKRAADRQLEATALRVARLAIERLADARAAYFQAVAAEERVSIASANFELAAQSLAAVEARHEAGAADALDESLARGPLLSADLDLRTARIAAADAKRQLAARLSIDRTVNDLELSDALPQPELRDIDIEKAVATALDSRLDLRALASGIAAAEATVQFEHRRALGNLQLGPIVETPPGADNDTLGPSLNLTLPLFDQNQAQVARADFQRQQRIKLLEAARANVAQDVRGAAARLNSAIANLEFVGAELMPQTESALDLANDSYAAGQISLNALLSIQQRLLDARLKHIELRLEAAVAGSYLKRVSGMSDL